MRILYTTAHLPYGRDEAFLLPEIMELQRQGHEVLVVPRSPGGNIVHGAGVVRFSSAERLIGPRTIQSLLRLSLNSPTALKNRVQEIASSPLYRVAKNAAVLPKAAWLGKLAREWHADHIHCHWAGTTATMAMLASHWSGVPWSFTLHRWDIVENNLLQQKARSASLVRFISEDGLRMAEALGVPRSEKTRVIHMGVPLQSSQNERPDGRVVLCPARLVEVKGHRYLLEAWRKLRDRSIHGELWLAGDGPLRGSLESLAVRLGIRDSVRFLGTVQHDSLLQLYRTAGIATVVLSSVDLGNGCHEGIPVALIEAMSFGIPVVGTRAGGTSELIRTGCGLMVGPGAVDELSAALAFSLEHRDKSRRMAEQGRAYVQREFDVQRTTEELVRAMQHGSRRSQPRADALAAG